MRRPDPGKARQTISHQLGSIIESRGLSAYAVAKAADVDPGVIARFLRGERGLTLATLDRVALALGLRLAEMARGKGRPAGPARGPRAGPARDVPVEPTCSGLPDPFFDCGPELVYRPDPEGAP